MKLSTMHKSRSVHIGGKDLETAKGRIDVDPHFINMVYKKAFGNPILAAIRETWTNAVDAVTEKHGVSCHQNIDNFIKIHLPTIQDPTFRIRDYGTGMSHEFVMTRYNVVGKLGGTKSDSNDGIGGFGHGKTAPYHCADTWALKSWKDGHVRAYVMSFTNGWPHTAASEPEVSVEPPGVEISIPVNPSEIHRWQKEYDYLIKYPPLFEGLKTTGPHYGWSKTDKGTWYRLRHEHNSLGEFGVYIGPVRYRLANKELLDAAKKKHDFFKFEQLDIRFDVGDIGVTFAREEVETSTHNNRKISEALEEVVQWCISELDRATALFFKELYPSGEDKDFFTAVNRCWLYLCSNDSGAKARDLLVSLVKNIPDFMLSSKKILPEVLRHNGIRGIQSQIHPTITQFNKGAYLSDWAYTSLKSVKEGKFRYKDPLKWEVSADTSTEKYVVVFQPPTPTPKTTPTRCEMDLEQLQSLLEPHWGRRSLVKAQAEGLLFDFLHANQMIPDKGSRPKFFQKYANYNGAGVVPHVVGPSSDVKPREINSVYVTKAITRSEFEQVYGKAWADKYVIDISNQTEDFYKELIKYIGTRVEVPFLSVQPDPKNLPAPYIPGNRNTSREFYTFQNGVVTADVSIKKADFRGKRVLAIPVLTLTEKMYRHQWSMAEPFFDKVVGIKTYVYGTKGFKNTTNWIASVAKDVQCVERPDHLFSSVSGPFGVNGDLRTAFFEKYHDVLVFLATINRNKLSTNNTSIKGYLFDSHHNDLNPYVIQLLPDVLKSSVVRKQLKFLADNYKTSTPVSPVPPKPSDIYLENDTQEWINFWKPVLEIGITQGSDVKEVLKWYLHTEKTKQSVQFYEDVLKRINAIFVNPDLFPAKE